MAIATQGVNSLFGAIPTAIKTKAIKAAETHEIVAIHRNLRKYWMAFIWNLKMLNTCNAASERMVGYRIALCSSRLHWLKALWVKRIRYQLFLIIIPYKNDDLLLSQRSFILLL